MTTRQEKVSSLVKREVSAFILEEKFEGITGLVTVTHAEVSRDLEHAKIYVSVVGQDTAEVLEILKDHIYEIQGVLNRKLVMKKLPRIAFCPDSSGEYASKISGILQNLNGNHHN